MPRIFGKDGGVIYNKNVGRDYAKPHGNYKLGTNYPYSGRREEERAKRRQAREAQKEKAK